MITRKLVLEQHRTGDSKHVHLRYKVIKAVNATDPYVGKELSKDEVNDLVVQGFSVEIVEKKR
jgi:hypothetical protein